MPKTDKHLALDDQLCFSLYSASMAVGRTYKPRLDALGITYPQYLVLHTLWERDRLNVGEVADRLALEPSTVTPLVKRLVAAGLITRERDPDDDRRVVVSLTEAGRAMRERSACLAEALVAASGMSLERLRRLNDDVRAVRDAVAGQAGSRR